MIPPAAAPMAAPPNVARSRPLAIAGPKPGMSSAANAPVIIIDAIVTFGMFLVRLMQAQNCLYELLDSSGVATRDAKRHGAGWLAGQADSGWAGTKQT
jgi:hypothetical protein